MLGSARLLDRFVALADWMEREDATSPREVLHDVYLRRKAELRNFPFDGTEDPSAPRALPFLNRAVPGRHHVVATPNVGPW